MAVFYDMVYWTSFPFHLLCPTTPPFTSTLLCTLPFLTLWLLKFFWHQPLSSKLASSRPRLLLYPLNVVGVQRDGHGAAALSSIFPTSLGYFVSLPLTPPTHPSHLHPFSPKVSSPDVSRSEHQMPCWSLKKANSRSSGQTKLTSHRVFGAVSVFTSQVSIGEKLSALLHNLLIFFFSL